MCRNNLSNFNKINEISVNRNNRPPLDDEHQDLPDDFLLIREVTSNRTNNGAEMWIGSIKVGNTIIRFKLDIGSQANIIPRRIYDSMMNIALQETKCCLLTYLGEQITPIGKILLNIAGNWITFQVAESGTLILRKEACVTLKLLARIDSLAMNTTMN